MTRAFRGCRAVVAVVKEAVESRRGCRLRRRCCAANPPLGPWCVRGRGLCERQCPAGSAAVGHSRLLAAGTKEEEKREAAFAVFGLGGGREGTAEKGQAAGQIACPKARTRRRPRRQPVARVGSAGRRGAAASGRVPRPLRTFRGTFLSRRSRSPACKCPRRREGDRDTFAGVTFSGRRIWFQALYGSS